MKKQPVTVTLTESGGAGVLFEGQGAIIYTSGGVSDRAFSAAGLLTLGDMAQLMSELMDTFGDDDMMLAACIALVARRLNESDSD